MKNSKPSKYHLKPGKEGSWYSMSNPFLNREEKYEVKTWYQSPGNFFWLSFFTGIITTRLLDIEIPIFRIGIYSWFLGATLVFTNWFLYPYYKKFLEFIYKSIVTFLIVRQGWKVLGVLVGAGLIYQKHFFWGGFSLLAVAGLGVIFEPLIIYHFLSSFTYGDLHAKYAFFKRFYSKIFPFELKNTTNH